MVLLRVAAISKCSAFMIDANGSAHAVPDARRVARRDLKTIRRPSNMLERDLCTVLNSLVFSGGDPECAQS